MRIGTHQGGRPAIPLDVFLARVRNRLRIASKNAADARATVTPAEEIAERQQHLLEFYGVYEELVETLCDAAQYGPSPAPEKSYAKCRVWMNEHYAPVRRYVVAYLQFASEDALASIEHSSGGADAFEALVAAPDLEAFLSHDDGLMISRLTRTREALNQYAAHLRQLAKAA